MGLSFDGQVLEGWDLGSENDCGRLFFDDVLDGRFVVLAYVVGFYGDTNWMSRIRNPGFFCVVCSGLKQETCFFSLGLDDVTHDVCCSLPRVHRSLRYRFGRSCAIDYIYACPFPLTFYRPLRAISAIVAYDPANHSRDHQNLFAASGSACSLPARHEPPHS